MQLPQIAITRPVLASMMNLALVIFGLVALSSLPVRELPDIDPPIVTVTTVYPGAAAEVVETEVTERIEAAVNGVEGIELLSSESREQLSEVTVRFTLDRDIDLASQDVRDRVSRIQGTLPEDVEDPVVAKQEADARPIMWVAVFSDKLEPVELTDLAENVLRERLQTVPGVSSIFIGGAKRFAIRIRLDPDKLVALDTTVLDVEQALRAQNVELPSGRVEGTYRELVIKTEGEFKTPEEFGAMPIRRDGDRVVRLRDIGQAFIGVEDERGKARYNSRPTIGLGVVRQSKANTVAVADGIKAEVAKMQDVLPPSVQTFIAYDESTYIKHSIQQVWSTLAFAFILVVLTVYAFLLNRRATIVPSLSIPVSILATFLVLGLFAFSVNIITMLALVLAIGLVVDDSIVVLENVYRHVEMGEPPLEAAKNAMSEISFAVIATTLALVAVFVPLAFQTSTTGRLFVEFAIALCGAVVISTFVALTLTPTAAARLLKPVSTEPQGGFAGWMRKTLDRVAARYARTLAWVLDHRRTMLAVAASVLGLSIGLYSLLDTDFLPDEDKGRLFGLAIAPQGSTPAYTDKMMRQLEAIVADVPEVAGYFSAVALSRGGPGQGQQGFIFVRMKEDRDRATQDVLAGPNGISAKAFRDVEGAFAFLMLPQSIGSGFGQPFQLVLQNPDLNRLNEVASEVAGKLQAAGFLNNVRSVFQMDKPELRLQIDRARASHLGVSVLDVSRTLQILFGGNDLSNVKRDGKSYDVIVDLQPEARDTPKAIHDVYVRNDQGRLVSLDNVLTYTESAGPSSISRYQRMRSATIEGAPMGLPLGEVVERTEAILADALPADFRYEWEGNAKELQDTGQETLFVILLAILVTYMVLAAQFESLIHPLTVMVSIPFGAFGAFLALWLLGHIDGLGQMFYAMANYTPDPAWWARVLDAMVPRIPAMNINLYSMIGMVLLIGIVTKNSILLVEFANQIKAKGKNARDAMLEAGKIRLRPILMTALATVAGILPIAVGLGAGAESRRPMGVVIIGGMLASTVLTLLVVPVIYTLIDDAGQWVRRKLGREVHDA